MINSNNNNTTITHKQLLLLFSFASLILVKVRALVTSVESSVLDIAVLFNTVSRPVGVCCQYATPSSVLPHKGFVLLSFFSLFLFVCLFVVVLREKERGWRVVGGGGRERERERERESR